MSNTDPLRHMWAVYDCPPNAQRIFLARKWWVTANGPEPTVETLSSASLDTLREELKCRGLTWLERSSLHDDPAVLEVWL